MAVPGAAPDSAPATPRQWPAWLAVALTRLLARLPYRLQYALGPALGKTLARLNPYRRTIVEVNLELCFPELNEAERRQLGQHSFAALGRSLLETVSGIWAPDTYFDHAGSIEGLEHLEAARREGNGVILISGHFCSPDFAGRILMQHHRSCFTYHELRNPVFDRAIQARRKRNCNRLIHRHDSRGFIKALRAGETVWYAPDQDMGTDNSVFASFFGQPASTLTATSRLAALTGATVLPFVVRRLPAAQGYALQILPALEGFPGEDAPTDTRRFNRMLEAQIRANPDQYLWTHRRFKTRPVGQPKVYPPKPRRLRRLRRLAGQSR